MKFSALLQKIAFFVVVFATCFSIFAPPTYAADYATYPRQTNAVSPLTESDVPNDVNTKAQVALIAAANTIICQFTGLDMLNHGKPCLTINFSNGKIGYSKQADSKMPGGLLGQVSTMIGSTYDLPVHTNDYTRYLSQNFGLTKKAYAQGVGFTSLNPLLGIWTRMRDLCYLAFAVIFVVIGFGIMLRVKIDPRTVMSIQNQIPKIIISILLITFSYAIAGLLVDTMWTATYLGINILTDRPVCAQGQAITAVATDNLLTTPLSYVDKLFSSTNCSSLGIVPLSWNVGQTIGALITSAVGTMFTGNGSPAGSCVSWTGVDWGECIRGALTYIFTFIFGIAAFLVILIAIFVQLIRVWFMLIKAYIYVIMYTLLGPFYIFLGLVPGTTSFGFEAWIRYMASGLSMFPATIFIFLTGVIVANNDAINSASSTDKFIPPLVGNPAIQNNFGMLIALGAILIAPEVANMMRNVFKAQPSKYTGQILQGAGIGAGAVGALGAGVGRQVFGKQKNGQWGPGTYHALRKMNWYSGGGKGGLGGPATGLGKVREWAATRDYKTKQPRVYVDPNTGHETQVVDTPVANTTAADTTADPTKKTS